MFKQLALLDWKNSKRQGSLAQRILMGFGKAYFGFVYLLLMVGLCAAGEELVAEQGFIADNIFFRLLFYIWAIDFTVRYFFQKMPTANIKPLLIQNVKKSTIVRYNLLKNGLSFFNIVNVFMAIALYFGMIEQEFESAQSAWFALSFFLLLFANNFLVQLVNHISKIGMLFIGISALAVLGEYFQYFSITDYTQHFYMFLYQNKWLVISCIIYVAILFYSCYNYYFKHLNLESAMIDTKDSYTYYSYSFLDRFGKVAPFLKLDLKLLTRNKRMRMVLWMSLAFVLYGLLVFNSSMYGESQLMHIMGSIVITGGFMLMFGQYVPSWDSSYYPLMMTQNIPYRTYLEAKWTLMVIGTVIASILSSFYLFYGVDVYLIILAIAMYNIGWNCYWCLLIGVFVRSKIDLNSTKNAFGDSKAFNINTLLLSLPLLLIPFILYVVMNYFFGLHITLSVIAILGFIGIFFKKIIFDKIEKLYKQKKYETIKAYK